MARPKLLVPSVEGRRKYLRSISSSVLPSTLLTGGSTRSGEILIQYADNARRGGRIDSEGTRAKHDPELNLCINKTSLEAK